MSLNKTPASERKHIVFLGKTNAGKSSLINAVTSQNISIVSDIKGTTTDPVRKTMEILPLGPVVLIDTPGFFDDSSLGLERSKRSLKEIEAADIAVLCIDIEDKDSNIRKELLKLLSVRKIPCIICYTKAKSILENKEGYEELLPLRDSERHSEIVQLYTDINHEESINYLKEHLARIIKDETESKPIVGDLLKPNDRVILVIPIDSSAPKGRLIMPQQLVIRDLLDNDIVPILCKESMLKETLEALKEVPDMVITDSQVFNSVEKTIPKNVKLTSFSILMARYKGNLSEAISGANMLDELCDNDYVLISEGCTHHRQCEDIGTVKLPKWIKEYTGKKINFEFSSGRDYPENLNKFKLIVHCGGCMLSEREAKVRYEKAKTAKAKITNYGIIIAKMNGILDRSTFFEQVKSS